MIKESFHEKKIKFKKLLPEKLKCFIQKENLLKLKVSEIYINI